MQNSASPRQSRVGTAKGLLPVLLLTPLILCLSLSPAVAIGVVDTLHNLSDTGTGKYIAPEEERVCIFCHTPHHADVVSNEYMPLWSRSLSAASYTLYTSSTIKAAPGQPTGGSRLCLSCHDGTIALGMLSGGHLPSNNSLGALAATEETNLSQDLSNDHPISFKYDNTLALASHLHNPGALPSAIRLEDGRLECTSCHDAHLNEFGMFLVKDNTDSGLCETCHNPPDWDEVVSSHHWNNSIAKCESCHTSHGAGQPRLLIGTGEEDTCYLTCHYRDPSVLDEVIEDGIGVQSAFAKPYRHPVGSVTGVHDPSENPLSDSYHVECSDCHNSHAANAAAATAPDVNGALTGVKGVNTAGVVVEAALFEYEICFKCHSTSDVFHTSTAVNRQINEPDLQLRFNINNPSYHPVAGAGKNPEVPSLKTGYDEASQIYCTDCHNSDDGVNAGGIRADGPHGSIYPHLLAARYEQGNFPIAYVESNYNLCWRCHDPASLITAGSFHAKHVEGQGVPCSVCHDPHGVSKDTEPYATARANAFLINFDKAIVTTGVHDWDEATSKGTCTVSCHTLSATRNY